jgi:hypothetical protein
MPVAWPLLHPVRTGKGADMVNVKTKRKSRNVLTKGQNRLLKESLKQLLGPGLTLNPPQRSEREERASFLRDALNSKILESEWLV